MLPIDAFLTTLYVTADDFCKQQEQEEEQEREPERRQRRPGPAAALSPGEVLTLALFGQLCRFRSERDFYRFAHARLRPLFPTLPDRSQFNRLQALHQKSILSFGLHLSRQILQINAHHNAQEQSLGHYPAPAYEVLDRCGIATRWCGRRGVGWLPAETDKGICSRLGYFHGLHLLTAATPEGVITGFGVGSASAKDQPIAEAFLFGRHRQDPRLACVGQEVGGGYYVLDRGFSGAKLHQRWCRDYGGVRIVCAPQKDNQGRQRWPKEWRTWLVSLRQIIESVHEKLLCAFRLERERPHGLRGFFARLSAKVAMHNFCIYLNKVLGRQPLEFAELIDW